MRPWRIRFALASLALCATGTACSAVTPDGQPGPIGSGWTTGLTGSPAANAVWRGARDRLIAARTCRQQVTVTTAYSFGYATTTTTTVVDIPRRLARQDTLLTVEPGTQLPAGTKTAQTIYFTADHALFPDTAVPTRWRIRSATELGMSADRFAAYTQTCFPIELFDSFVPISVTPQGATSAVDGQIALTALIGRYQFTANGGGSDVTAGVPARVTVSATGALESCEVRTTAADLSAWFVPSELEKIRRFRYRYVLLGTNTAVAISVPTATATTTP